MSERGGSVEVELEPARAPLQTPVSLRLQRRARVGRRAAVKRGDAGAWGWQHTARGSLGGGPVSSPAALLLPLLQYLAQRRGARSGQRHCSSVRESLGIVINIMQPRTRFRRRLRGALHRGKMNHRLGAGKTRSRAAIVPPCVPIWTSCLRSRCCSSRRLLHTPARVTRCYHRVPPRACSQRALAARCAGQGVKRERWWRPSPPTTRRVSGWRSLVRNSQCAFRCCSAARSFTMASTLHSRLWLETATCTFSAAPERMWRNTLATRTWRRVPASCVRNS